MSESNDVQERFEHLQERLVPMQSYEERLLFLLLLLRQPRAEAATDDPESV